MVGARLGGEEPPSASDSGVPLAAVREIPAAPLPFNCCEGVLVSGRRCAGESQNRRLPETRALGCFGGCRWRTGSATGSQRPRGGLRVWVGCGLKEEQTLPSRIPWGRFEGCWPHTGGLTAISSACPWAYAPSVSRSVVALPQGSPSRHFQAPRPGWAPPRSVPSTRRRCRWLSPSSKPRLLHAPRPRPLRTRASPTVRMAPSPPAAARRAELRGWRAHPRRTGATHPWGHGVSHGPGGFWPCAQNTPGIWVGAHG